MSHYSFYLKLGHYVILCCWVGTQFGNQSWAATSYCTSNGQLDCISNASYIAGAPADLLTSIGYTRNGTTLTLIPVANYYNGSTKKISVTEPNLISSNISGGTSIFGVTGTSTVVNTSSATAVASDLLSGQTAFVNGALITGTLAHAVTLDASVAWPGAGYYAASISNGPSAAQVCSGITLFGTTGTADCPILSCTPTGSLASGKSSHTATLLPNGKVLLAAGLAELYNPTTGTFAFVTGDLANARSYGTSTLLPNGKVLIAGGMMGSTVSSAELYDVTAGTNAATGSMTTIRTYHNATLLPNGKVLISGGFDGTNALASAELYDPNAGTFAATGSLITARFSHSATLLPNGKVLITGGNINGSTIATAELYNPNTGTFAATGSMISAKEHFTATLLPTGKVLIAGGSGGGATAELYDPSAGTFTATGSMTTDRSYHTATLLPTGKVLMTGGWGGGASTELYDPNTGTFAASGSMSLSRYSHTATLLPNGKVLIAGGSSASATGSAELFY